MRRTLGGLSVTVGVLVGVSATPTVAAPRHTAVGRSARRPDVVLIVTDDQRADTLRLMPAVRRTLARRGITFRRAVVSTPLCCPSRASILTGRHSHTTGVYANWGPHGGWPAFRRTSQWSTIATALDAVGYRTALIGKYMNGYDGGNLHVPPGWDRWFVFAGPNGGYYDYTIVDQGLRRIRFGSDPAGYSTDVIRRRADRFIRRTPTGTPFFLMVAPFAPHWPAVPAPRHAGSYAAASLPLGPSFNEADVSDKPRYVRTRDPVDVAMTAFRERRRWESLRAVDELVARIVAALRATGRARETLIVFTSDNGKLAGEHRLSSKGVPYGESIGVPLVVRYPPAISSGRTSSALVSNVDIAPTIADFAGATLPADGVSLRPLLTGSSSQVRSALVLEHLDTGSGVPSYCGVRSRRFAFVRYQTGEEELYDLAEDPHQLRNVVATRRTTASRLRALTKSLCVPRPPGFSW